MKQILASHLRRDKCNINGLRLIRSRGFLGRGSSPIFTKIDSYQRRASKGYRHKTEITGGHFI